MNARMYQYARIRIVVQELLGLTVPGSRDLGLGLTQTEIDQ